MYERTDENGTVWRGAGSSYQPTYSSSPSSSNWYDPVISSIPIIGTFYNAYQQNKANKQNYNMWLENNRRADTAHQREIADLKRAGLNPLLSATGGSGSQTTQPIASQAPQIDPLVVHKASQSTMQTQATQLQLENIRSQNLLLQAQARKADAEATTAQAHAENAGEKEQVEWSGRQTALSQARIVLENMMLDQAEKYGTQSGLEGNDGASALWDAALRYDNNQALIKLEREIKEAEAAVGEQKVNEIISTIQLLQQRLDAGQVSLDVARNEFNQKVRSGGYTAFAYWWDDFLNVANMGVQAYGAAKGRSNAMAPTTTFEYGRRSQDGHYERTTTTTRGGN